MCPAGVSSPAQLGAEHATLDARTDDRRAGDLGGEANWPRRTQIAIDILHRLPVTGGGGAAPAWTLERLP